MHIAVFPFEVERFDDIQGVYGRQIARHFVDELTRAGVETVRVQWFAQRGERKAHVVVEAPLPWDVQQHEMRTRSATLALTGHVRVQRGETTLALALRDDVAGEATDVPPSPRWQFEARVPRDTTPCMLERAVTQLLAHLQVPRPPASGSGACDDRPMDAWTEKLVDDDNNDLLALSSLASLAHPDFAWSHLLRKIALSPASQRPQLEARLQARIDGWENDFQGHLALRAQRALARHRRSHEATWRRVCTLAARLAATEALEEGLRAIIEYAPDAGKESVELGILLVSDHRPTEALTILQSATDHPQLGDVARTYLGVAFAKLGDLTTATEHWQRVTRSGTDKTVVALAREFLAKAQLPASS